MPSPPLIKKSSLRHHGRSPIKIGARHYSHTNDVEFVISIAYLTIELSIATEINKLVGEQSPTMEEDVSTPPLRSVTKARDCATTRTHPTQSRFTSKLPLPQRAANKIDHRTAQAAPAPTTKLSPRSAKCSRVQGSVPPSIKAAGSLTQQPDVSSRVTDASAGGIQYDSPASPEEHTRPSPKRAPGVSAAAKRSRENECGDDAQRATKPSPTPPSPRRKNPKPPQLRALQHQMEKKQLKPPKLK